MSAREPAGRDVLRDAARAVLPEVIEAEVPKANGNIRAGVVRNQAIRERWDALRDALADPAPGGETARLEAKWGPYPVRTSFAVLTEPVMVLRRDKDGNFEVLGEWNPRGTGMPAQVTATTAALAWRPAPKPSQKR